VQNFLSIETITFDSSLAHHHYSLSAVFVEASLAVFALALYVVEELVK
jgi:hypothetical protein